MSSKASIVRVQIGNPPSKQPALVHLNLEDNLSKIRIELGGEKEIINDKLSFARKVSKTDNHVIASYEFSEVVHEYEDEIRLKDIIGTIKNDYVLYLIVRSKPMWEFLNDKCKLDYGRTMTNGGIKKAENRTFIMKKCEWTEFGAEGCQNGEVEYNSNKKEDWMMKTNLFFTTDNKVQNFVNLGLSVGTLKAEGFQSKTSLSYRYTNHAKLSMKFRKFLEPTSEFIKAVEEAIESKNPEKFIQITEKFGQFVPSEVILGGRVHFENYKESTEHSAESADEFNANLGAANIVQTEISSILSHKRGNSKNLKFNYKKLIGGEQPENFENFDEKAEKSWIKSLKDYKSWDCIEFKDPISIFHLLPDELRKQIFSLVGKKILYLDTIDYNFQLDKSGEPDIVELRDLKIPLNISKIIQNEDADCSMFATVVDTEDSKNDYFNCQIFCPPPNGKPSLMIHCIQNKFKKRKYKLKIRIMVIGFDADFKDFSDQFYQFYILKQDYNSLSAMYKKDVLNCESKKVICLGIPVLKDLTNSSIIIGHHFYHARENKIGACTYSYCSKNKYYDNLPNFSFYTLVVSNYSISNAFCTKRFDNKRCINFDRNPNLNPKYISLFFTCEASENNYAFLKQKSNQIKIKYPDCKKSERCICKKNKKNQENIECVWFDPCIR